MTSKNLHPNIKYRMFDAFLSSSVYNMMLPFLPIYFAKYFGIATAGVLMSIYLGAGILSNIIGGHLSDIYGRKKILIITALIRLISLGIIVISNSSLFKSPEISFAMFVLINMAASISSPTNQAMLLELSTPEERKRIYGIEYWTLNTALFIGILIGGFFYEEYLFYIFIICFLTSVISMIIILFFIKESKHEKRKDAGSNKPFKRIKENFLLVSKNKNFIILVCASFLLLSIEFQGINYLMIKLSESYGEIINNIHFSGTQIFGFIRAENALLVMVFGLFITKWFKNVNPRKLIIIGIFMYVFGYVSIILVSDFKILILCMLIITIGEMIYSPLKKVFISDHIPENNAAAFLAINNLVSRGASVTGSFSIILGAYISSYIIALILILYGFVGLILYLKIIRKG